MTPRLRSPALLTAVALALLAPGARPAAPPRSRTDSYGDPLPPGVIARLGTVRFRHGSAVDSVAFSPDGKVVASTADGLYLWDASTGRRLRHVPPPGEWAGVVAFSPDGKTLAVGAWGEKPDQGSLRLYCAATGKEVRRLTRQQSAVHAVAFAPRGKNLLASGEQDGTVRLWDPATGRQRRRLTGHRQAVLTLAFSPDGRLLASGGGESGFGKDYAVRLWDVASGKELARLNHDAAVHSVAFSPDGKLLAVARDIPWPSSSSRVVLWSVAGRKEVRRLPPRNEIRPRGESKPLLHHFSAVAFPPGGKALAAVDYQKVIAFWDPTTGKELLRVGKWRRNFFTAGHPPLAFSPDGKVMAGRGHHDIVLHLWDPATGKELHRAEAHSHPIAALALAPGGKVLVSVAEDENTPRLWDPATGRPLRRVRLTEDNLSDFAFSPDGKALAALLHRDEFCVWDVGTGKERFRGTLKDDTFSALAFGPGGRVLASATPGGGITLWDADTGRQGRRFSGLLPEVVSEERSPGVHGLAFSPDGRALLSAQDGALGLWDAATGRLLRRFSDPRPGEHPPERFVALAVSPDGRAVASLRERKAVRLWEVASGRERCRLAADASARCLAFACGGRLLAVGYEDGTVRFWDVAGGGEVRRLRGHRGAVSALLLAGKRLFSGAADTTVLAWDVTDLWGERRLPPAKLSAGEQEAFWSALAGADPAPAYRALRRLEADPRGTVALVRRRLSAVHAPSAPRLRELLADLDSERFEARERARRELARLGELAAPALKEALAGKPPLEAHRSIRRLLRMLSPDGAPAPEVLRGLRAVELLERIGDVRARGALEELARGAPDARLTREAKSALRRLEGRAAAKP